MDELEALNMLLRLVGSSPVNAVSSPQPDVANARKTLDRVRKKAQRKGWWFNVDYNVLFQRNELGNIVVPKEIISIIVEHDRFIVIRDGMMYDNMNNTYMFTCDITARQTIRILAWDSMPEVMQQYCADFAAAEYVRDELEDPTKEKSLKDTAKQSFVDVKNQHVKDGGYNMFNQSRVREARAGVQPYQRGRVRNGILFDGKSQL